MAQRTEQILLQIKQDNSSAITSMAMLKKEMDAVRASNRELQAQNKRLSAEINGLGKVTSENIDLHAKFNASINSNNEAIVKNEQSIKLLNAQYREQSSLIENNIKAASANDGSLNQMKATIAALNVEFRNLTKSERENTDHGKAMKQQIKQLSDEYKAQNMAIGNTFVNVGNYGEIAVRLSGNFRDMQKQIRDLTGNQVMWINSAKQMEEALKRIEAESGKTSSAYAAQMGELTALNEKIANAGTALNDLTQVAGQMKDAMDESAAAVNYVANDTAALNSAIAAVQFGASVFTAYKSATAALGLESEAFEKSMQKLTATIAFLNAAQQIQNALQKESAVMMGVAKVQSLALNVANKLQTAGWIGAGVAMKAFNAIAAANPLVLLLTTLALVVAGIALFVSRMDEATAAQNRFNEAQKLIIEYSNQILSMQKQQQNEGVRGMEQELELMRLQGASLEDQQKKRQEIAAQQLKNAENNIRYNEQDLKGLRDNTQALEELNQELVILELSKANGNKTALNVFGKEVKIDKEIERVQKAIDVTGAKVTLGYQLSNDLEDARQQVAVVNAQVAAEQKKSAEDARNMYRDNARKIRDLSIQMIEEQYERERQAAKAKYDDDLQALTGNAKQKNELRILLEQKYNADIQAINEKSAEEEYTRTVAAVQEEMRIRLELAAEGSSERLRLELESLETQRVAAIASAQETGVSVDLINAEFAKRRNDAAEASNEMRLQKNRELFDAEMAEKDMQFETSMLQLQGQQQQQAEFEVAAEQERLATILEQQQYYYDELGISETEYALLVEQQRAKVNAAIQRQQEIQQQQLQSTLGNIRSIAGSMGEIFSTMAEQNEEYAGFAEAMALFDIAINTAMSISNAIAGATAAGAATGVAAPFTTPMFITEMVAITLGAIAQTASVLAKANAPKAPKFAEGGVFRGSGSVTGAGTSTSDSINAHLSNGESVNTAATTAMFAPLLSPLNQAGGGVPFEIRETSSQVAGEDFLARAFAKGMALMPRPVVSVEEINNTNERVQVIENLRNI